MNCPECGSDHLTLVWRNRMPVERYVCGSTEGVPPTAICKLIKSLRNENAVLKAQLKAASQKGSGIWITQAQSKQWSEEFCKAHGIEVTK